MKKHLLLVSFASLACSIAFAQNRIGTGKAKDLYTLHCASCHGQNLEGGQGSSLIDDIWKYGSEDSDIVAVIENGLPDLGMIPWKGTLSDDEIRSLVILIREQAQLADREALNKRMEPVGGVFKSELHSFKLEKVAEAEGIIWSMDFMPDQSILATERSGTLWHFKEGKKRRKIAGTPKVWAQGQGGLLEVQLHPDFKDNGWIYLSYSENVGAKVKNKDASMTAVVRGRIKNAKWVDQEEIYHVAGDLHSEKGVHFGSRFVFKGGYLFFSIGDRGYQDYAQDLTRPNGKIHRIYDDGRIPEDNPFVGTAGAVKSIWSYGHRNPQGLDMHPLTGQIWETEHGPRGGDETNLIRKAQNFGWPIATYGMNYNGQPITHRTSMEGVLEPKLYWVPSIAVCGIDFYEGDAFAQWKNNLFVSGMASQELHRLVIDGEDVLKDEIVMKNQGRVRDIANGPDGYLYVSLTNGSPRKGEIYRLVPAD
ncbi:MAG: PQQ-dependent sugar dehydrogenase [Verrucomicrobiota bacterium]